MDEADLAQRNTELEMRMKLRELQMRGKPGPARTWCIGCGETIPEARRRAIPGCERCVTCQMRLEAR